MISSLYLGLSNNVNASSPFAIPPSSPDFSTTIPDSSKVISMSLVKSS